VICSTEHRFFFTAHPPGPLGADCAADTHSAGGLKKPEPLNRATDFEALGVKLIELPASDWRGVVTAG
jgi:hypothetical protein